MPTSDWEAELSQAERKVWESFVRHARRDAFAKIDESAFVMSLCPTSGKADVKFAVELGFGIMLNKPIVLLAMKGVRIPPGLRRVAHSVIQMEHDFDTEAGQEEMTRKFRAVMFLLGLDPPSTVPL